MWHDTTSRAVCPNRISMERYNAGFRDKGTKTGWTERNPGFWPIVDYGTPLPFALGVVVALVDGVSLAEKIVALLNAAEMSP